MNQIEFNWKAKDGLNIYAKEWQIENPKAVVCLVHGAGEHCNRYNHLADFFAKNQYAMLGFDRRGHGRSEGPRGRSKSYDFFLEEVDDLIAQAKSKYPNKPIIVYGHSMGGNIVLQHLVKRKPPVKGVIVTGPFIKLVKPPSSILVSVGKFMNKLTGGFVQPNGLDVNDISRDKNEVQKYIDDPLVHDRMGSVAGLQTIQAGEELFNYKGQIDTPTLIMHGEADNIIDVEGSRVFVKNTSGKVDYKEWAGLYHEIHNDPEKEEVMQYAVDWMNANI